MGAAVGQKGVDESVVRAGFETAEEHPVLHAEFGGPDHVLDEVGVDFQDALFKAVEELGPLVEGVAESLADVACGEMGFEVSEDEAVEFICDGAAAGAADQLAAGGRGRGPAGLGFDLIEALDEVENWKRDFGGCLAEVGELAPDVGKATGVAEAVLGGDGIIDRVAVAVDGAGEGDGVGLLVVPSESRSATKWRSTSATSRVCGFFWSSS